MVLNNFRTRASVDDEINLNQPTTGKIVISVADEKVNYYGSDWFGFHWDGDAPFYSVNEDSVMMNTVRLHVVKSKDSAYHIHRVRFSHGNNPGIAKDLASQIQFNTKQVDSVLYLPPGFAVTPNQKFRNQQVLIVAEIPVGKRFYIDRSVDDYHWFSINLNRRHRGWNVDWDDQWDDSYSWSSDVEYVMTNEGIKRTDERFRNSDDNEERDRTQDNKYRYKNKSDSSKHKKAKDSVNEKTSVSMTRSKNSKQIEFTIDLDEFISSPANKSLRKDENENLYFPSDILSKMM